MWCNFYIVQWCTDNDMLFSGGWDSVIHAYNVKKFK